MTKELPTRESDWSDEDDTAYEARLNAIHARQEVFRAVAAGEISPAPSPTAGDTFYNHDRAVVEMGRVPGHPEMRVWRRKDGTVFVDGGHYFGRAPFREEDDIVTADLGE